MREGDNVLKKVTESDTTCNEEAKATTTDGRRLVFACGRQHAFVVLHH